MVTPFSNVPVSIHRLRRCEAVVAPAQMQDLWGRGRVCSGKSPLSDNSSRVCKMGSSVAHIDLVGTGLRCRARHRGCVVPSLCESDSPVHCSRVLVRFLLSRYWTTCEEANLIQRCLGENPPFTQRKTYRRIVNDPTSDGSSWGRPLLCWPTSSFSWLGATDK